MIKTIVQKNKNVIFYIIIGGFCFIIDNFLYYICVKYLDTNYIISNIISVNFAIIISFNLNFSINFKLKNNYLKSFISFCTISWIGLVLSSFFLFTLFNYFEINIYFSKVIAAISSAIFQYILNIKTSFNNRIAT